MVPVNRHSGWNGCAHVVFASGLTHNIYYLKLSAYSERSYRLQAWGSMNEVRQIFIERLVKKGADPSSLPGILRALSKILSGNPDIDPAAANEKLSYLGWKEIEVDYHLLQLALAYFESEDPQSPERFSQNDSRRQAMRLREVNTTPETVSEFDNS